MTDGRFSGASHGIVIGHITPEAHVGGPIALIEDGDIVTIDIDAKSIDVDVDDETMASRREKWVQPAEKYSHGVLKKYATLVTDASQGGVLEKYW